MEEELQNRIEELENRLEEQSIEFSEFKSSHEQHKHNGVDGSIELNNTISLNSESWLNIGNTFRTDNNVNIGATNEANRMFLAVGSGSDSILSVSDSTKNTQFTIENQPGTTGAGLANQSFMYAFRAPVYTKDSGISITSGGSTLTDNGRSWTTNELQNAYVNVYDTNGTLKDTRIVASNTSTVITVTGTWTFTDSDSSYIVFMPVYWGSADYPWRRLYTATDIRFGAGTSGGTTVCFIKHGTGTPESVVTAQVGSLYLRLDGGASTTLYVKESGTGNTGWIAK